MKYFPLVWAWLFRAKTRTLLTLVSICAAFLLFGLLDAVRTSFGEAGRGTGGAQRLQTGSRLSFTQTLPLALEPQIEKVPGVKAVSYANWFGGAYQDPHNLLFSFAVAPGYLDLFPEVKVAPDARAAFDRNRTGALVGEELARRFHWKVGDRVPLQSTIFPDRAGSKTWTFVIVGVIQSGNQAGGGLFDQAFLLNWKTFDETTPYNRGQVGWYITRIADIGQADAVGKAIDALSENSDHETLTQTEQAAYASRILQLADIGLIVTSIIGAVFFTLLLLSGNTMMQAVRERTGELAVLKTIGFSNFSLLALVLSESVLLQLMGGLLGLGLAKLAMPILTAASAGLVAVSVTGGNGWLQGIALMTALGLLVGALPASRAMRQNVVAALSRH